MRNGNLRATLVLAGAREAQRRKGRFFPAVSAAVAGNRYEEEEEDNDSGAIGRDGAEGAASSACNPPRPAAAAAASRKRGHRIVDRGRAARSNSNALEREKERERERPSSNGSGGCLAQKQQPATLLHATKLCTAERRAREALVNNDPASRNYFRGTRRRLFFFFFPRTTAFDSRSLGAYVRMGAYVYKCAPAGEREREKPHVVEQLPASEFPFNCPSFRTCKHYIDESMRM